MLSVEDRYYKLNRIILKILGIWPYWKSKWKPVQMIMITTLYLSAIFVQLAVLVTHDYTFEFVINILSCAFISMFILGFYYLYYFRADAFKEIMEHMYYDWKSLKNKVEIDILDDYASVAKLLIEIFTFGIFMSMSGFILIFKIPVLLDIVLPLNESRPLDLYIEMEFFDQSKYINLLIVYISSFICLGMLSTMVIGVTLYSYGLHICGVFKITNYRMEIIMDKNVLRIPSPERERIIFERLICAVDLHRRNLLFCDMFMSYLEKPYVLLLIFGVASTSISMLRFMQSIMVHNNLMDMFISLILISYHICFIFFGNHFGQQITNNNAEIFDTVYKLQWYAVSLNVQKLLLFVLQKGCRDLHISIGNVFDASYEGFTKLTTTALSYFTVLYAVQ